MNIIVGEEQIERIAADANAVAKHIGAILERMVRDGTTHTGIAIGLTKLSARHVYHDHATEEDLLACARAAWTAVLREHATENGVEP